ncbi:MAG: MFS transporter [Porphyromonadaceae bacterium]|nr:MAG: MFS transporter [Porphyromonadaceae bacterium]
MRRRLSPSHLIRTAIRGRDSAFHPRHTGYKWFLLANVMLGTFMAVLDSTIVNVGLPKIMASFGVGLDKIEWVITAYMLSMAVMLPTSGWMADRFGYKRMYFWGLLLFTLGSLLCGMSVDENTLILSRIIQGLGAGTLQPPFLTEHSYIMLSLYIRGFAMGILFTPLSTISLLQIPREKMAQASGLANTIRQLGGSLGIAILATLLSTRVAYHTQMYGQAIQATSPAYRATVTQLGYSIQHQAGSSPSTALKQGQALIVSNLGKQAFIQGVDDDFMFAAFATLIGGIPIIFLRVKKKKSAS